MKINDKLLDKLAPITFITAGFAWLVAVILIGLLSQSFLIALAMVVACAFFVFGFYKFLDTTYSYVHEYSPFHYLCWFLMITGLFLAAFLSFSNQAWWIWVILFILQIPPIFIYFQTKVNEDRTMDDLMEDKLTREQQAFKASHATNIHDYASALGLKVIDMRGNQGKKPHISQFAGDLPCQHCFKHQRAREWPINGDYVPFYYQKEPGNYSLKLTCPQCGKDWFIVWDQNPGSINPLF